MGGNVNYYTPGYKSGTRSGRNSTNTSRSGSVIVRGQRRGRSRRRIINRSKSRSNKKVDAATPRRGPGSGSRTMVQKEITQDFDDLHSGVGVTYGSFVVNRRKVAGSYRKGHVLYTDNWTTNVLPTAQGTGSQQVVDLGSIGTYSQWTAASATPLTAGSTSAIDYFSLNPNRDITGAPGGTTGGYPTGYVPANDRFVLEHGRVTLDMVNLSSVTQHVDIYFIKSLRDSNYSPLQAWQLQYTADALGKSIQIFPPTGTAGEPPGYENYIMPYAAPTDAQGWKSLFRVMCKKTIALAPSATHSLRMKGIFNIEQKLEVIQDITQQYIKGSVNIMAVVLGQVVRVTDVANTCSFATNDVSFILTRKLTFRALKANAARVSTEIAQVNVQCNSAAVANEKIVNISDAIASFQGA